MLAVFFIGVLLTIFTLGMTVSMLKYGYVECVVNSYKELEKVKANIIGTILNDYDNSGERLYYRHESDKKISKFLRKFKR